VFAHNINFRGKRVLLLKCSTHSFFLERMVIISLAVFLRLKTNTKIQLRILFLGLLLVALGRLFRKNPNFL